MSYLKTLVCAGLLLSAAATPASAQPNARPGAGGWGPGSAYGRMFDPKTVETTSGEITNIALITPTRGMTPGVHLTLKTDKGETLPVHLGPQWYIDQQSLKLATGDQVQVRGSRITFQDKPALIAAEVIKNGQTMRLRDDSGVPAWAGWRRGRR